MNLEEKLERLTERTDALTQSLELLAAMHRDYEVRADERMEKQDRMVIRLVGIVETLVGTVETMAGSVTSLGNIVGSHEKRIERLENGKP